MNTIASIWGVNMIGYLSWALSVPRSLPRATLTENCSLLGTDNVRGQISQHIFGQMEAIVYLSPRRLPDNITLCLRNVWKHHTIIKSGDNHFLEGYVVRILLSNLIICFYFLLRWWCNAWSCLWSHQLSPHRNREHIMQIDKRENSLSTRFLTVSNIIH